MSRLKRVWEHVTGRARVEEWKYEDGSLHYSYRSGDRVEDIENKTEADRIIELWHMKDVTELYRKAGWIG